MKVTKKQLQEMIQAQIREILNQQKSQQDKTPTFKLSDLSKIKKSMIKMFADKSKDGNKKLIKSLDQYIDLPYWEDLPDQQKVKAIEQALKSLKGE